MRHHHIDRRVARSAECSTAGRSPTEPEVIQTLVRRARAAGVVVFLKAELDRMPWQSRELIEAEAKRLRGGR
jgi:D-serine deaminase-like pyridoxal phosphate-dependent protein